MKKSIIISYIIILVVSVILIATTDMYIENERIKIDNIEVEKRDEYMQEMKDKYDSDFITFRDYNYNIILYPNIVGMIVCIALNVYTLIRKDNDIKKKKIIFWLLMIPLAFICVFYIGGVSSISAPTTFKFSLINSILGIIIGIFSFL